MARTNLRCPVSVISTLLAGHGRACLALGATLLATSVALAAPPVVAADDFTAFAGAEVRAIELIQSDRSIGMVGATVPKFDPAKTGLAERIAAREADGHLGVTGTLIVTQRGDGVGLRVELHESVPRVSSIDFEGNSALSNKALLDALGAQGTHRRGGPLVVGLPLTPEVTGGAITRLSAEYMNHGYLMAEVAVSTLVASADATEAKVSFEITEGALFRVGTVTVERAEDPTSALGFSPHTLRTTAGVAFSQDDFQLDGELLTRAAKLAGFANAEVASSVKVDQARSLVSVTYSVATGRRSTVPDDARGTPQTAPTSAVSTAADFQAAHTVPVDVGSAPPAEDVDLPGAALRKALKSGLLALAKNAEAAPKVVLVPGAGRPWGSDSSGGLVTAGAPRQDSVSTAQAEGTTSVSTDPGLLLKAAALRMQPLDLGDEEPLASAARVADLRSPGKLPGQTLAAGDKSPVFWISATSAGAPIGALEIIKGTLDAKSQLVLTRHPVLRDAAAGEDPEVCAGAPASARKAYGLWRDVDFDAKRPAVYIVRAAVAATCAPAWRACVKARGIGACTVPAAERMLSPRAWTSPIWSGVASP